jgi:hypothetical protein
VSPNALSPADALANVFSERKKRAKLGLSQYVAEAAEQAADSGGDLTCRATCAMSQQYIQLYGWKTTMSAGFSTSAFLPGLF